jgi:dienelactone hydrolase
MKKYQTIVAITLMGSAVCHAQDSVKAKQFEKLDADKNGAVALEEYKARTKKPELADARFAKLDADKNGTVSLDEWSGTPAKTEAPAADAAEQPVPSLAKLEALANETTPPVVHDATGFQADGAVKPIFFDALDWEGKPTRVFAWIGLPDGASKENPAPGIVLVHGGGGTAFKDWVKEWNAEGFAAISIAVEGQTEQKGEPPAKWQRHENGGPKRPGTYSDFTKPLEDQWMYHCVADTILASNLLRSLPEVDPAKVGLMGVSWGGVITSTVIGLDQRFAFAIPTYGCGGLHKATSHYKGHLASNTLYPILWDPNLRLEKATMPVLWFSWTGDGHFPMDSLAASSEKVSGVSVFSLVPKMGHGHGPARKRTESYAFAKSVVQDGKPWYVPESTKIDGGTLTVVFHSTKPLDSATLTSTTGTGDTSKRQWIEAAATLKQEGEKWIATAPVPQGTTACFINVTSGKLVATSDYLQP